MISVMVSATNGGEPVTSSYRMIPSAQRSQRASTLFEETICSGDM